MFGQRELLHAGHEFHEDGSWVSRDTVMVLHGLGMILGWCFCITLGTVVSRYLKGHLQGGWFGLHIWIQSAGVLLTVISFGLIFAHISSGGGTHFIGGPHHVLGTVVVLGSIGQVLLGIVAHLVWYEGKPPGLWDKLHWWLGRGIYVIALVNVYLGINLLQVENYSISGVVWISFAFFLFVLILGFGYFEMNKTNKAKEDRAHRSLQDGSMVEVGAGGERIRVQPKAVASPVTAFVLFVFVVAVLMVVLMLALSTASNRPVPTHI
eukprot:TRINITY_DN1556_c0_g1_i1.p1 TRINITY_DN1556_c0_g1~~TRINITY_DN1556_c0_g1_i1.p1  ORF type:complete len:300 (+),score=48.99 TRINITY_DN1556_c0_g1_i1:107-901(+)